MRERGDGAFPSLTPCVCGEADSEPCLGRDHATRWVGETFNGTRCPRHGGHKFQPVVRS